MRTVLTVALSLTYFPIWAQQSGSDAWNQPYRPQYHFSPRQHWTNDPNGLVYFEGEYHLFFQYNPFGNEWGHMSWGHAVSRDLLHWQELGVALPEENGVMIFTGSTVVDEHNSSGFCSGKKACMVAVYTGHTPEKGSKPALQTQNLAYSNDRGRTWTKYVANPVLNLNMADFRDPKVFWSEQSKRWIMAVSLPNDHKVRLYASADLKKWAVASEFGPAGAVGGQWECPELFQLPVDGQADESRWVLKVGLNPGARLGGSGEQYFVGQFDGTKFTNDNPSSLTLWTDYGKDCYCALTFNGLPRGQNPVMIGWMDNWQYAAKLPTSPWRGQMTFPRSLSLRKTAEGIRLYQQPTDMKELLGDTQTISTGKPAAAATHSFIFKSEMQLGSAREAGWKLLGEGGHYTAVGYDSGKQALFVDRTNSGLTSFSPDFPARIESPLKLADKVLRLQILVDRCSVEVFADGGKVVSTNLVFPPPDASKITQYSTGGAVASATGSVENVRSVH
jgi:sucrose-6-phosphate hydrolase SacC (GH32 family)